MSTPSPPPSPAVAVQVTLEPLPALARLEALWRDLEARAEGSFFLSWSWIGSWLASIGRRPELLVARLAIGTSGAGQVVGLGLVLARLMVRHRVMPVWTAFLNQTGDPDQDVITIEYNDILADRRVEADVRDACLRHLLTKRRIGGRRVGELVLGGLDEARIPDVQALGRPMRDLAETGSSRIDLAAVRQSGHNYQESLKPSIARRIRRSLALYRERGAIEVRAAETEGEALRFFDEAGRLHQERWTAKGCPGAFAYPFYVDFHRRLIRSALPEGRVELLRVAAGGEPIGFLYNLLDRNRVYYYFSGFRFEPDNRLKPGLVCHSLCIQRHLERGMEVYDFMGGQQRYKSELGQPGPRIVAVALQRPSLILAAERPLRRLKQALENRANA